jgi:hypothetical protein
LLMEAPMGMQASDMFAVLAGAPAGIWIGLLVAVVAQELVAVRVAELVAVWAVLPVGKWVLELVGKLVVRQGGVPVRRAEEQAGAPAWVAGPGE